MRRVCEGWLAHKRHEIMGTYSAWGKVMAHPFLCITHTAVWLTRNSVRHPADTISSKIKGQKLPSHKASNDTVNLVWLTRPLQANQTTVNLYFGFPQVVKLLLKSRLLWRFVPMQSQPSPTAPGLPSLPDLSVTYVDVHVIQACHVPLRPSKYRPPHYIDVYNKYLLSRALDLATMVPLHHQTIQQVLPPKRQ